MKEIHDATRMSAGKGWIGDEVDHIGELLRLSYLGAQLLMAGCTGCYVITM